MGTLVNGIKEIFATANITGSNVMLCGNDGTPDGHMTMANLASVLGVAQQTIGDTDLNNLNTGLYLTQQTTATIATYNYPSGEWGLLIVLSGNDGSAIKQIHFGFGGSNYTRHRYAGSWSAWKKYAFDIPDFYKDYNNLSALAGAIGANPISKYQTLYYRESIDNDINGYGIYMLWEHSTYGACLLVFTVAYNTKDYDGIRVIYDASQYVDFVSKTTVGSTFHLNTNGGTHSLTRICIPE